MRFHIIQKSDQAVAAEFDLGQPKTIAINFILVLQQHVLKVH